MTEQELRERFKTRQRWLLAHYGEYDNEELISESVEQLMRDVEEANNP